MNEITKNQTFFFKKSRFTVGIVKEKWHLHSSYIKACKELGISYYVIDIFSKNWLEEFKDKKVDFLVIRPSVQYSPWKEMFDNRIKILQKILKVPMFPNFEELWIWENKLRTLDWLKVNNLPHPKSHIFYDFDELLDHASTFKYPIVYKSNSGSGSSGVKILKNKSQLKQLARKIFVSGIRSYRKHKLDKEHGFMILQHYLKNVKEWRIIRIGDFYFGFEKIKIGNFHSGSHKFSYGMPPVDCLNLVKDVTDKFKFKFVDIDIFITEDELLLINEIQPYFAQKDDRELLKINDESGRLYFDDNTKRWEFEKGVYCKNNLCNLRIKEIIKTLSN